MLTGNIKAIIFDMDGVLVNTEPHHIIIERRLFSHLGLDISPEEHSRYLGTSSDMMWTEIVRNHNLTLTPGELRDRNTLEILEYFSELDEIELMPGIKELLDYLYDKGIPMGLASSSETEVIDIILERTGFKKYFRHKVSYSVVGKSKPEPDIYLHTARLLGADPAECLVVEDSPNGIRSAKSAGMTCVAYNHGVPPEEAKNLADEFIASFTELPSILKKYM